MPASEKEDTIQILDQSQYLMQATQSSAVSSVEDPSPHMDLISQNQQPEQRPVHITKCLN